MAPVEPMPRVWGEPTQSFLRRSVDPAGEVRTGPKRLRSRASSIRTAAWTCRAADGFLGLSMGCDVTGL